MEKMLFSGVQSNSEVALIAIKGIKNQPGIAAKVFGAIAEEKINVELILQSIGRGENKDISFVVAQDEADHAVETLKKAFDEADYEDIISDKEVGIVSIVGAGMMSNSGAASKMFEALYNRGINIHLIYTSEIKITVLIKESRVERAVEALKELFNIQKENKKEILERESEKEKRKRTLKTKCTRGIIYFIGLIVLALGIVLNTKTLLGVSPIISIPYNICHIWHLNLGAITFVFYCFCVLIESILKGKEFKLYELLQIPMSLVTSVFINIFDQYLNIVPDTLGQKLLVLFFAIVVTGIGAATMVNMKLVPNPADALAAMIGDKLGKGMGIGKNVFDVTCFCTSGIIGLVFTRHIIGLGIGTVLAVIFTGRVIAVYNYFLKHPMQNLAGITVEL